jgi:outer membrane protein
MVYARALPAQQQNGKLDLTYEKAIQIALKQNVDLRTRQNEMIIVKAEKDQSRGELAPMISANINAFKSNGNTFLQQKGETINTKSQNLNGSLDANLNLFSSFSQINRVKRANTNFQAQQQLVKRTSQDVVFQVTTQYLQVLLDQELLEIAEDNLKTQEKLFEQIEGMVEAGNSPKSEQYDQMAVVKNMELEALRARNKLSADKAALSILLLQDPTVDLKLFQPDWDIQSIRSDNVDLESLYESSLKNRPDLKQFVLNEESAERSVAISKSDFAPKLFGFVSFDTRFNDLSSRTLEQQWTSDNKYLAYGVSLRIPIYTGLRNKTALVRQKVMLENSKIFTENLKNTILNDVRLAYQNFLDVRSGYEVSIARLEATDLALKVQQERYSLGVGSLIELTNANNNHISAAAGNAQARLNLLFQKVVLDYHTGILQIPQ